MLERISHPKFGLGVVLDERLGGSGKPVSVVVFDNAQNVEHVVLTEFLQQSSARMPAVAKNKRKPRGPKPEPIRDELLVNTDQVPALSLDVLDLEEPQTGEPTTDDPSECNSIDLTSTQC